MVAEPGSYPRLGLTGLWLRRKKLFLVLVLLLLAPASAMEERLRLLEEALRQTMTALQDSQNRVTALEGGAGFPPQQPPPPTPSPANTSLVDMRMLGKPAMFSGDRANWKRLVIHDAGLRGSTLR
jgi:hypothetical protein